MTTTPPRRSRLAVWALLAAAGPAVARADGPGQVTVGHARFTAVTPNVIRLEYAGSGHFVEDPSWFAVNRAARFAGGTVTRRDGTVTIDTGPVRLTYRDDGRPFSPANLSAVVRKGDAAVTWHPGDRNPGNLGGTVRTLDGATRAQSLGEGVVSRDGWYLLDDSRSPLFANGWVRDRPADAGTDWYLFGYGTDYRAALRSLTAVGGAVPLPRRYTLGLWYSRYWSFTADEFKQIVAEYDQHGFPLDTMVMDMGWHLNEVPPGVPGRAKKQIDTWTGYTWDAALIPHPAELLKWMHDHGLHVTLNDHPALGVQPHEAMYAAFMRAMGRDPASGDTVPFDAGDKRYLDTFYAFTHAPREREGVDFWWLDWQQYPRTRSVRGLTNLQLLNWYNYEHTATAAGGGGAGGQRGQSFSRWAGWGDHRYPIQFSGDADTGFPMLAAEVPFTATAGNVGAFFWSHDIGGHTGGRNEESYPRWCQFGALSAALRSHSTHDATTDRRPWNYPDWAEASMRVSFRLRARLMPYLYTAVRRATVDSVPFTRPIYLDHPTVEEAYHNAQEYQFGDDLLVAPIASPGAGPGRLAAQAVWFPPGRDGSPVDWFDFFTGEQFAGGEHAVAAAPIDQFPLYVRGGVPLPMRPYVNRPATAPIDTLVLRCYPGRDGVIGTSELYEDDGTTVGYAHGQSATTPLAYVRQGRAVTVTAGPTAGTFPGRPGRRTLVVELPDTRPGATADHGTCSYDAATGTTRVELPAAAVDAPQRVTVMVDLTPPDQVTAAAVDAHVRAVLGQPLAQWRAEHPRPDPELAPAIAAAQGVALMPVNQQAYGYGNDVALLYMHNHSTGPEQLTLTTAAGPQPLTVTPGQAVVRSAPAHRNDLRYARPATLAGLPDGLPPLHVGLPDAIAPGDDWATRATATASTGNAAAATDASTDGWPGDQRKEWVTAGETVGAWLRLTWDRPTRMTRVLLWDRPNRNDQVRAGTLDFSDGSTLAVDALPNDGILPGVIEFPAKTCTWVKFTVTRAGERTENIGLSEMAVGDGERTTATTRP